MNTLVSPLASAFVQVAIGADASTDDQSYVLRDGAREIRIVIVNPASVVPQADSPPRADPAGDSGPARLSVDGGTTAGRTDLVINGHQRNLQDCRFAITDLGA